MYRLIIADDEKRIRNGLWHSVDWAKLGFEVTGVFSDGSEILESLQHARADVILTDIKMTKVSGLDVAKYVHEHKLPCHVVLVSGHREFELALEGLRYGVEDYILKPTNIHDLEAIFQKIRLGLAEQEQSRRQQEDESLRARASLALLDELFWTDMVMGAIDDDAYINSCLKLLMPDIDVRHCALALLDLEIRDYDEYIRSVWEQSTDQFNQQMLTSIRDFEGPVHFRLIYQSGRQFHVLAIYDRDQQENFDGAVDALRDAQTRMFGAEVSIAVRQRGESLLALKKQIGGNTGSGGQGHLSQTLEEQKKLLISNISIGNMPAARTLMHTILKELEPVSPEARIAVVKNILSTLLAVLEETDCASNVKPLLQMAELNSAADSETLTKWIDRTFDRISLSSQQVEGLGHDLVQRALQYVQEHIYMDISQENTANHLYVSPSYLSRIFRKQTGESYVQHVTRLKMEKAIELLKDPQYRAYQVGEMLGYNTPKYFAKLFQAYTGMTPTAYRKKVLHMSEVRDYAGD